MYVTCPNTRKKTVKSLNLKGTNLKKHETFLIISVSVSELRKRNRVTLMLSVNYIISLLTVRIILTAYNTTIIIMILRIKS